MGVNAVAARAGTDKVLIYRYFGGFEGLLESLAAEREIWPAFQLPAQTILPQPTAINGSAGAARYESADATLWEILQTNVQALKQHPLALEILVWSCAESNVLTRSQAKIRRRQTRKLKAALAELNLAVPGGDAAAVYAILWKAYCFALIENHRKETYKQKDWRLFDQAGHALFQNLRATDEEKKKKHKSKKHKHDAKADKDSRSKDKSKDRAEAL